MSFPLVGCERVKTSVCGAISSDRLPHAILIEGDAGTGRHTLASYIAKSAVCTGKDRPCGSCRDCHLADVYSHPDITVTGAESGKKNITVSQIRALRAEAYVKPHSAAKRVFIIDGADTMNEQSQNALLKVLEEPPETVVFILVAESKSALLETVVSRCTVFSLFAPDISDGEKYISSVTERGGEEIKNALCECRGNIGRALALLGGSGNTKTQESAERFISLFLKSDEYGMLKVLSEFDGDRVGADRFFSDLKTAAAAQIRKNIASPDSKALFELCGIIPELESSLKTNINLSLLFSAAVCKAAEIYKRILK